MRYSTLRNFAVSIFLVIGVAFYGQGIYPIVEGQIVTVQIVAPEYDQKEERVVDTFPGTRDEYTIFTFLAGACFMFFGVSLGKFLQEFFRVREYMDREE